MSADTIIVYKVTYLQDDVPTTEWVGSKREYEGIKVHLSRKYDCKGWDCNIKQIPKTKQAMLTFLNQMQSGRLD